MTFAPPTKAEHETLASFRYAIRKFLAFSKGAATSAGLTPQAHQALLSIKGYPGRDWVTIGELAERLQVKPHSAVGLVDRLHAQKLVVREASTEDRRRVHVRVTPKGMAILEKLSAAHREELRRVGPHLRELLARVGELQPEEAPAKASSATTGK